MRYDNFEDWNINFWLHLNILLLQFLSKAASDTFQLVKDRILKPEMYPKILQQNKNIANMQFLIADVNQDGHISLQEFTTTKKFKLDKENYVVLSRRNKLIPGRRRSSHHQEL